MAWLNYDIFMSIIFYWLFLLKFLNLTIYDLGYAREYVEMYSLNISADGTFCKNIKYYKSS